MIDFGDEESTREEEGRELLAQGRGVVDGAAELLEFFSGHIGKDGEVVVVADGGHADGHGRTGQCLRRSW